MRKTKEKRGITLLALIITIIVLLILAGVSINVLVGDNGIISNAQTASVKTKFAKYNEELGMNAMDDTGIYASGNSLKNYIKSIEDQDLDKFVIIKSKLLYIGADELESEVAESLGLGSGANASAVSEIQAIISGVIQLGDIYNSIDEANPNSTANGLIGTKLVERNSSTIADGTWNLIDEYNSQNVKTERYDNGWYYLESGETYTIEGETKKFTNNYVVNYETKEFVLLSDKAVNWNVGKTLAVPGAVLNLDPSMFAEGKWVNNSSTETDIDKKTYEYELGLANEITNADDKQTALDAVNSRFYNFYTKSIAVEDGVEKEKWTDQEVQKTGNVVYDSSSNALEFNTHEDSGYLKLLKTGFNFENGFTLEFYGSVYRLSYDNGKEEGSAGLFCKIKDLKNSPYYNSMRFFGSGSMVCKLIDGSSWTGTGYRLTTNSVANIESDEGFITAGKDFFYTVEYIVYKENTSNELYDEYMISNKVDKIVLYMDGKEWGYTYFGHDSYEKGRNIWDNDDALFYVGVVPAKGTGCLYYLQGLAYSIRMYDKALNPSQIKDNYDVTLKYRSSF